MRPEIPVVAGYPCGTSYLQEISYLHGSPRCPLRPENVNVIVVSILRQKKKTYNVVSVSI
jgi:hypothetical protein